MSLFNKPLKVYYGHVNIISYNCDNEYRRNVHKMQLKLLKDFINLELKKYGGKSCLTSVNILYQNYTEEQLAEFDKILKDYPIPVNSISVTLTEKKGPAYARNQLLKLSYKTDDDFFILMDDDVMCGYPDYTFIDYMRKVFFKHFNTFGFAAVRPPFFFKSRVSEVTIRTDNNPYMFSGAFNIWKNSKKFYNCERYYDEKLYIGEDINIGLENLLLGIPCHILFVPCLKDMANPYGADNNSSLYVDADSASVSWKNGLADCMKRIQEKYKIQLLEKDGTFKRKDRFYEYVDKSKNIQFASPLTDFVYDDFSVFYKPIMKELNMKRSAAYPKLYKPTNTSKWKPAENIIARSSWEYRFMQWADFNESVVQVGSENVIIKYYNPIKKRDARYFVDFKMTYRNSDGTEKKILIEIKPYFQTQQPVPRKERNGSISVRGMKVYNRQLETYLTNVAKWEAAKKYAKENGYEFWILTENELPIK